MLHHGTRKLFNYWNEVRAGRPAPFRAEISPSAISGILPSTFILECDPQNRFVFRLAGTTLCLLFGGELKRSEFAALLDIDDRNLFQRVLTALTQEKIGAVLTLEAISAGQKTVQIEAMFLPLADEETKILGVLHVMELPYWIGAETICNVTISSVRIVDADVALISLHNRPAIMMGNRTRAIKNRLPSTRFAVLQGGAMLGGKQADNINSDRTPPNLTLLPGGRD